VLIPTHILKIDGTNSVAYMTRAIVAAVSAACATHNPWEALHEDADSIADVASSVEATIATTGAATKKADIPAVPVGRDSNPDPANAIADMAGSVEATIPTTGAAPDEVLVRRGLNYHLRDLDDACHRYRSLCGPNECGSAALTAEGYALEGCRGKPLVSVGCIRIVVRPEAKPRRRSGQGRSPDFGAPSAKSVSSRELAWPHGE
jgi:hypothetical protein